MNEYGITKLFLPMLVVSFFMPEEQIRWVYDDNWRIIFVSSP